MLCKTYVEFSKTVRQSAFGGCQYPACNSEGDGVHHYLKRSRYPALVLESNNGMWICGYHHEFIEEELRQGRDVERYYPLEFRKWKSELKGIV